MGDLYVEQHGRRIHSRAHLGFACLAKIQHSPVEGDVTWIHLDKNVRHTAYRATEYIRSVEQRTEHLFRPELRIHRQSREFSNTSSSTSISVQLSTL